MSIGRVQRSNAAKSNSHQFHSPLPANDRSVMRLPSVFKEGSSVIVMENASNASLMVGERVLQAWSDPATLIARYDLGDKLMTILATNLKTNR
ncbi:hypothetical protein AVEN_53142-1 [Araneus ventricosus]|uniref:Uncharacterized protein n=1 Tax=Araneus ventricosus TaxID=182803 RepID=A0A4Y2TT12_ARAVE|nr:hypothetical protein AVEN_53142-1 [Araneus ventricosus]